MGIELLTFKIFTPYIVTGLRLFIFTALATVASLTAAAQNVLQMRDTITDPSFVYPESYEADTHRLNQDWLLRTYTSLEGKTTNTPNTPATDDVIVARLKAMPTEVEMVYNSIVRSCIDRYVDRGRGQVERMLGLSAYYMPIFEQALEAEGVPLELRYLPVIESALNPNAVSRAGATGLWQFMLPTGKGLGLEISTLVDERRDPIKSSQMAAKYLHQLYNIYNDWSLAIAAYNCGPGNINKALKRAGEGKKDFWDIYPYLPAETRGYLPGFIAANYAMTYFGEHGISPVLAKRPVITDSVHVKQRVHFQQIADVLQIPIEEIRILNPQYRQDVIPGDIKPYALVLPSHQTLAYIMSEDSIVSHNAHLYARRGVVEPADGSSRVSDDGEYIIKEVTKYHRVKSGDTFTSLARRYGVTASSIRRVNGIKTLKRGRTIKIVTTQKVRRPAEQTDAETKSQEVIPITYDQAVGNSAESQQTPAEETPNLAEPEVNLSNESQEPTFMVISDEETIASLVDNDTDTDVIEENDPANDLPAEDDDEAPADDSNADIDEEDSEFVEIAEEEELIEADPEVPAQPADEPVVQPVVETVVESIAEARVAVTPAVLTPDAEEVNPVDEVAADEEPTDNEGDDQVVEETVVADRVADVFNSRPLPVVESKPTESQANTVKQQQPAKKPAPKPVYVKVKKGDTMAKIARHNGMTLKQIQNLNPGVNPSRMKVGDRIRVK